MARHNWKLRKRIKLIKAGSQEARHGLLHQRRSYDAHSDYIGYNKTRGHYTPTPEKTLISEALANLGEAN